MAAFVAGLPAVYSSSEGSGSSSGAGAGAGAAPLVKILSWNANGLRAALGPARKADVQAWLAAEAPDILCIQETKIDGSLCAGLKDAFAPSLPHAHFTCCAEKKGYAGTAIFSREAPLAFSSGLGDGLHDAEGRVTTAEYPGFYVVNVYVPNSGMKLERLEYRTSSWDPALRAYVAALGAKKPVVLIGDLNVAYLDMDVHDPVTSRNKTPGFCDGERDGFAALLSSSGAGLVDVWRAAHPKLRQFTYWSARFNCRGNNKGWRLDYALVSPSLTPCVVDTFVRSAFPGADHVPLGLTLRLPTA